MNLVPRKSSLIRIMGLCHVVVSLSWSLGLSVALAKEGNGQDEDEQQQEQQEQKDQQEEEQQQQEDDDDGSAKKSNPDNLAQSKVKSKGITSASDVAASEAKKLIKDWKPVISEMSPEEIMAYVQNHVLLLKQQVTSFQKIYEKPGLGAQTNLGISALQHARDTFDKKEYEATIRNATNYLNWTQVPNIDEYLEAQYLLGKSYLRLAKHDRAIKALARYVSTLTTNPEKVNQRSIEVMSDLLLLVEKNNDPFGYKLNPLMAALTSLELPKQHRAWIYFYAGKSARITGYHKVGIFWLDKAIKFSTNQHLVARARYNRSLIYIKMRRFKDAIDDLQKALAEKNESAYEYRQYAKLTLARVYVYLKKPQTALKYYGEVGDKSDAYREALFEKTYVYLETAAYKEAILAAEEYLIRFPKSPDLYRMRTIKAYLDLRNNDIKSASEAIRIGNERLNAISQWLTDNYSKRETLTALDVNGMIRVTYAEVAQPPLILQAKKLFDRLENEKIRVTDIRNDLRNSIYSLGRSNIEIMNPSWQNRTAQLRQLMDKVLEAGDLLSQAEAKMYEKRLSPKDSYMFKASHDRRMRNFSKIAEFSRSRGNWRDWAMLGQVLNRMTKRFDRIKEIHAEIAALKLFTKTVKVRRPRARYQELTELETAGTILESDILRAVELTRSRQILRSFSFSDLAGLKLATKNYAENLIQENAVLSTYRQNYTSPQQKHLSDDLEEIWGQWEHILTTTYSQIIGLELEIRREIRSRLGDFDDLIAEHDKLRSSIETTTNDLNRKMGQYLGVLLEHYNQQIAVRQAKHQKWQADLNWLAFNNTDVEKQKAMEKYDLEQQILNENLKDLEQGVMSQWP